MSRQLRALLPKISDNKQSPNGATGPSESVELPRKRKMVPLACHWCRAHKTKCDGERPACGPCRQRNKQCEHDDDPNTTPHANLRRQYRRLAEQQHDLAELFEMLRTRPEQDANAILQQLRKSGNVRSTLNIIKEGDLLVDGRSSNFVPDGLTFRDRPVSSTQLMLGHPHAYPFLPPMRHELGPKRKSILEVDPAQDGSVTAEGICNARYVRGSLARDAPSRPLDATLTEEAGRWAGRTKCATPVSPRSMLANRPA